MIIDEDKVKRLLNRCDKAIEEGFVDSFRSYEEGVKDALNWILNNEADSLQPSISLDEEGDYDWEEGV